MPIYEIEVTRLVEFKGFVQIEAADEVEAYAPAKAQADAGQVALEQIYDHTDMGPVRRVDNAHISVIDNRIAISCPKHGCAGITGRDDRQFCIACGADITEEITQATERMQ